MTARVPRSLQLLPAFVDACGWVQHNFSAVAGFGTSPSVSVSQGITVSIITTASDTQIQAKFSVPTTAKGNAAVTVTANQVSSGSVNFFAQVPSKLQFYSVPGAPGGKGPVVVVSNGTVLDINGNLLLSGQCGVLREPLLRARRPERRRD